MEVLIEDGHADDQADHRVHGCDGGKVEAERAGLVGELVEHHTDRPDGNEGVVATP